MRWMILPLRRYVDFAGRSRRTEYWMFVLFQVIVYTLFVVLAMTVGFGAIGSTGGTPNMMAFLGALGFMALFVGVFWLAMLLPSIAVTIRRLHDSDRSGWWVMVYVVPYVLSTAAAVSVQPGQGGAGALSLVFSGLSFIGAIVLLVLMFLPGTPGMNRFGPDPKDPSGARNLQDVFG